MAGRGRGQRNVNASNVFSASSKSSKSREELAQIVGSWKKNKPRQNRGSHASNQNQLDQGDLSKILSDVINRKPESSLEEGGVAADGQGSAPSHDDTESPMDQDWQPEWVYSGQSKDLDLPVSPRELEEKLNSTEGIEKLGKILGTTRPPKIRFQLTNDYVPSPLLDDIAGSMSDVFTTDKDNDLSKAEAQRNAERMLYSGHPDEDDEIATLKDFMQTPDENVELEQRSDHFDKALTASSYILDHNMASIRGHQAQRGRLHGQTLGQLTSHPGQLYDTYASMLDPLMDKVIKEKCAKDPDFEKDYEAFRPEFDRIADARNRAEEELGEDDEKTLQLQSQLHRMGKKLAKRFTPEDYACVDVPFFRDIDQLPVHEDYRGPEGDANFQRDFENQQVKLLPYEDAEALLPNATNDYMNGLVRGFAGTEAELDRVCFHATERLGSHHNLLHTKMVSDAVQGQRWEEVGSSVTVPLSTNVRDFVATQAIVAEYYKHTNDFRQHLENFIVTRLTKELRLLKEDTEDFVEVAQRLDKIREKKKKKVERRAFVLERAKQRSIENGTYTPATESIITRALARNGVVEEEDILDQALEYLRRDGKRFTHKDIPSIRKDNFDQKFRAIYFNGSLKPHDKARMVALTISNFIVSTEELQVAAGALEVMSAEPTTFEKQEKQMEQSQGGLAVNLDSASVTVNKQKVKANRLISKREGEVSWEGYNTSDFEESDVEDTSIPSEFDELGKFKPHNRIYANWAKVVDSTLDTSAVSNPNLLAEATEEAEVVEEEVDDFDILDTDTE